MEESYFLSLSLTHIILDFCLKKKSPVDEWHDASNVEICPSMKGNHVGLLTLEAPKLNFQNPFAALEDIPFIL